MKPSELLIAAKGLIDTPEKLIKGRYRRRGSECDGYCLVGAVAWAGYRLVGAVEWAGASTDQLLTDRSYFYLGKAIGVEPNENLTGWNDAPERTWEEVMEALDRAIEAAQEAGE